MLNFGPQVLRPHGPSFEQTWNIMSCSCFWQIMTALLLMVLQKKIFKAFFFIRAYVQLWTPNARTPLTTGPLFEQTWNIMSYWCFWQIMTALLLLVLQNKIFKALFPLKPMLNFGPQILEPHGPLDLHLKKIWNIMSCWCFWQIMTALLLLVLQDF